MDRIRFVTVNDQVKVLTRGFLYNTTNDFIDGIKLWTCAYKGCFVKICVAVNNGNLYQLKIAHDNHSHLHKQEEKLCLKIFTGVVKKNALENFQSTPEEVISSSRADNLDVSHVLTDRQLSSLLMFIRTCRETGKSVNAMEKDSLDSNKENEISNQLLDNSKMSEFIIPESVLEMENNNSCETPPLILPGMCEVLISEPKSGGQQETRDISKMVRDKTYIKNRRKQNLKSKKQVESTKSVTSNSITQLENFVKTLPASEIESEVSRLETPRLQPPTYDSIQQKAAYNFEAPINKAVFQNSNQHSSIPLRVNQFKPSTLNSNGSVFVVPSSQGEQLPSLELIRQNETPRLQPPAYDSIQQKANWNFETPINKAVFQNSNQHSSVPLRVNQFKPSTLNSNGSVFVVPSSQGEQLPSLELIRQNETPRLQPPTCDSIQQKAPCNFEVPINKAVFQNSNQHSSIPLRVNQLKPPTRNSNGSVFVVPSSQGEQLQSLELIRQNETPRLQPPTCDSIQQKAPCNFEAPINKVVFQNSNQHSSIPLRQNQFKPPTLNSNGSVFVVPSSQADQLPSFESIPQNPQNIEPRTYFETVTNLNQSNAVQFANQNSSMQIQNSVRILQNIKINGTPQRPANLMPRNSNGSSYLGTQHNSYPRNAPEIPRYASGNNSRFAHSPHMNRIHSSNVPFGEPPMSVSPANWNYYNGNFHAQNYPYQPNARRYNYNPHRIPNHNFEMPRNFQQQNYQNFNNPIAQIQEGINNSNVFIGPTTSSGFLIGNANPNYSQHNFSQSTSAHYIQSPWNYLAPHGFSYNPNPLISPANVGFQNFPTPDNNFAKLVSPDSTVEKTTLNASKNVITNSNNLEKPNVTAQQIAVDVYDFVESPEDPDFNDVTELHYVETPIKENQKDTNEVQVLKRKRTEKICSDVEGLQGKKTKTNSNQNSSDESNAAGSQEKLTEQPTINKIQEHTSNSIMTTYKEFWDYFCKDGMWFKRSEKDEDVWECVWEMCPAKREQNQHDHEAILAAIEKSEVPVIAVDIIKILLRPYYLLEISQIKNDDVKKASQIKINVCALREILKCKKKFEEFIINNTKQEEDLINRTFKKDIEARLTEQDTSKIEQIFDVQRQAENKIDERALEQLTNDISIDERNIKATENNTIDNIIITKTAEMNCLSTDTCADNSQTLMISKENLMHQEFKKDETVQARLTQQDTNEIEQIFDVQQQAENKIDERALEELTNNISIDERNIKATENNTLDNIIITKTADVNCLSSDTCADNSQTPMISKENLIHQKFKKDETEEERLTQQDTNEIEQIFDVQEQAENKIDERALEELTNDSSIDERNIKATENNELDNIIVTKTTELNCLSSDTCANNSQTQIVSKENLIHQKFKKDETEEARLTQQDTSEIEQIFDVQHQAENKIDERALEELTSDISIDERNIKAAKNNALDNIIITKTAEMNCLSFDTCANNSQTQMISKETEANKSNLEEIHIGKAEELCATQITTIVENETQIILTNDCNRLEESNVIKTNETIIIKSLESSTNITSVPKDSNEEMTIEIEIEEIIEESEEFLLLLQEDKIEGKKIDYTPKIKFGKLTQRSKNKNRFTNLDCLEVIESNAENAFEFTSQCDNEFNNHWTKNVDTLTSKFKDPEAEIEIIDLADNHQMSMHTHTFKNQDTTIENLLTPTHFNSKNENKEEGLPRNDLLKQNKSQEFKNHVLPLILSNSEEILENPGQESIEVQTEQFRKSVEPTGVDQTIVLPIINNAENKEKPQKNHDELNEISEEQNECKLQEINLEEFDGFYSENMEVDEQEKVNSEKHDSISLKPYNIEGERMNQNYEVESQLLNIDKVSSAHKDIFEEGNGEPVNEFEKNKGMPSQSEASKDEEFGEEIEKDLNCNKGTNLDVFISNNKDSSQCVETVNYRLIKIVSVVGGYQEMDVTNAEYSQNSEKMPYEEHESAVTLQEMALDEFENGEENKSEDFKSSVSPSKLSISEKTLETNKNVVKVEESTESDVEQFENGVEATDIEDTIVLPIINHVFGRLPDIDYTKGKTVEELQENHDKMYEILEAQTDHKLQGVDEFKNTARYCEGVKEIGEQTFTQEISGNKSDLINREQISIQINTEVQSDQEDSLLNVLNVTTLAHELNTEMSTLNNNNNGKLTKKEKKRTQKEIGKTKTIINRATEKKIKENSRLSKIISALKESFENSSEITDHKEHNANQSLSSLNNGSDEIIVSTKMNCLENTVDINQNIDNLDEENFSVGAEKIIAEEILASSNEDNANFINTFEESGENNKGINGDLSLQIEANKDQELEDIGEVEALNFAVDNLVDGSISNNNNSSQEENDENQNLLLQQKEKENWELGGIKETLLNKIVDLNGNTDNVRKETNYLSSQEDFEDNGLKEGAVSSLGVKENESMELELQNSQNFDDEAVFDENCKQYKVLVLSYNENDGTIEEYYAKCDAQNESEVTLEEIVDALQNESADELEENSEVCEENFETDNRVVLQNESEDKLDGNSDDCDLKESCEETSNDCEKSREIREESRPPNMYYPQAPGYPPHMPPPPRPQMPPQMPPPQQQMQQQQQQQMQNSQQPPPYRQQAPRQQQPMAAPRQPMQQGPRSVQQGGPRGPQMGSRFPSGPRQQGMAPRQRAPMIRGRGGGPMMGTRGPRPRMPMQNGGQMQGMQQQNGPRMIKRTPEQMQALQAKRKKMDVLVPDKHDDADCQVIAVTPKNTGLPQIQSIQGAATDPGDNSVMHLSDSITLSVRNPPPKPASPKKSDAKDVANILATRGITVTATAKSKEAGKATSKSPEPAAPVAINLNSSVCIIPTKNQGGSAQGSTNNKDNKVATVDLTDDVESPSPQQHQQQQKQMPGKQQQTNKVLPFQCDLCPAKYTNSLNLSKHRQSFHKTGSNVDYGVPLIDLKSPGVVQRLASLGIHNYIPLPGANNETTFALPIINANTYKNGNLNNIGATQVLTLGPVRMLPKPVQNHK